MNFIRNFENNLSDKVPEWEKILDHLGGAVDEEAMWKKMRESADIPQPANTYQDMLIENILDRLRYKLGGAVDLDEWVTINNIDTHLRIGETDICSLEGFLRVEEQLLEAQVDNQSATDLLRPGAH